ncbi:topoisomerase DNA-binding C4 zinc finger domain-containing protein, partial [bacterium]|nr:topoisomerase DNA-binding C4 zinc finger domain-containing protein [bacterium]
IKTGRFGKFIACSNYPKCKYTEKTTKDGKPLPPLPDVAIPCPREGCGGTIVPKRTRRNTIFYSCTNWKTKSCKVAFNDPPVESKCPECEYPIRVEKNDKLVCPECKHAVEKVR